MKFEEGMIVYACLNNVPTQCRITAMNFGGDGVHLVITLPEKQAYIVSEDELADNPEDCYTNHMEQVQKEYNMYFGATDSPTGLILHILHAAVTGRKIDGIEKSAIIDRASQYTQVDVNEYLAKLDEIEKRKGNKNEVKECC